MVTGWTTTKGLEKFRKRSGFFAVVKNNLVSEGEKESAEIITLYIL